MAEDKKEVVKRKTRLSETTLGLLMMILIIWKVIDIIVLAYHSIYG